MRILATSLLVLLAAALAPAVEPEAAADQAEIEALEQVWNQAHLRGEVEALERLWSEDLTIIVPGMPLMSKADALGLWRSMPVTFTRYDTTDVQAHVHGDTAVVTGRLHRCRDFGGRVADEDWLFTKTYARMEGRWRVAAYHASTAPPAP